jgi:hypothetical protein
MAMATHDQLQALWSELVAEMRTQLAPGKRPSAEMLGVARRMVKDGGVTCPDDKARKDLDALYRAYLQRLSEALQQERPSSALLAEAGALLRWVGVSDVPGTAAAQVADQLLTLQVPFTPRQ